MARNKYDVDEVLEDKFDLNQLKRLLAYLIPYRKRFVSVGFMMLSASAFTMLIPQFFQKVMDVCIPNKDMKGIAFYSFLTLLAAFYSAFSLRYKIKYTNQIGQQIIHDMRYDIFEHLQELPFSYYDDRPHGKIQVRVVNYVNSISDLLSNGILNTITDLCNLVFIIVFMLILNVRLTLVCLCGLPILAIVIVVIKKKQRTAWQVQSNKQSNLNAYIAESINGIRVTQSFVREDVNSGIFNNPFIIWGKYHKGLFWTTLKLSFQFTTPRWTAHTQGGFYRVCRRISLKSENADEPKTGTESALDGTAFRSFYDLKRGLSIAKLLAEKMGGTITADTLLKPLKQDAVHRCIYMAYLKNGAYTSAVEQIIAFAEAHALQEEGTQPRSGFARRIAKQPHTP